MTEEKRGRTQKSEESRKSRGKAPASQKASRPPPGKAGSTPPSGATGVRSGLQPGGTKPAGGRMGGIGSIDTGGGSTGPRSSRSGSVRPPEKK